MKVKDYSFLNEQQIKEIRELEGKCCKYEDLKVKISLDSSLNFDSSLKPFFLLYDGDTLASMLSIFVPTRGEAEISGYTSPEYRRKGLFTTLIGKASVELERYGVTDLLLLCDNRSSHGKMTFRNMKARYGFSEHTLFMCCPEFSPKTVRPAGIILRKAIYDDLEVLAAVDALIFGNDVGTALEMLKRTMDSKDREQYAAVLNDRIIGICSVFYEGKQATVFGVGILPQFQGMGYGRMLMELISRIISGKGIKDIIINVNSSNKKAYNLYRSLGFKALYSVDYYRLKILDLKLNQIP